MSCIPSHCIFTIPLNIRFYFPVYRWRNGGLEKLGSLAKVTAGECLNQNLNTSLCNSKLHGVSFECCLSLRGSCERFMSSLRFSLVMVLGTLVAEFLVLTSDKTGNTTTFLKNE